MLPLSPVYPLVKLWFDDKLLRHTTFLPVQPGLSSAALSTLLESPHRRLRPERCRYSVSCSFIVTKRAGYTRNHRVRAHAAHAALCTSVLVPIARHHVDTQVPCRSPQLCTRQPSTLPLCFISLLSRTGRANSANNQCLASSGSQLRLPAPPPPPP